MQLCRMCFTTSLVQICKNMTSFLCSFTRVNVWDNGTFHRQCYQSMGLCISSIPVSLIVCRWFNDHQLWCASTCFIQSISCIFCMNLGQTSIPIIMFLRHLQPIHDALYMTIMDSQFHPTYLPQPKYERNHSFCIELSS